MRLVTSAALVALLAAPALVHGQQPAGRAAAAAAPAAPSSIKTLSRAEFDALASNPSRLLLIDVRQPDEVSANGGFPVYLSIQLDDVPNQLAAIPRDRTIVLVSNHANRALRAGEVLVKAGFTVAGAIGSETYESEGGTRTVRITPRAPKAAATAGAADKR